MTEKLEYSAADMASAAAGGWRDGQRAAAEAAQPAPAGEREALMPTPDEIHQMAFEEGQPAENGDGYLFCAEEFDCFVQRLLDSIAAQQRTQAAGVPDGERLAELLESVRLGDDEAKPHGSGATYWNNAVLVCQVAIRDALAAAPAQPEAQGECCHEFVPFHPACVKCGNPYDSPAAQDQPEVQRLREALTQIAGEDYEAPHDADNDYISHRKSACITRMRDVARDALAASTGQEVKP